MIQILVVDDHKIITDGLSILLPTIIKCLPMLKANSGEEAINIVKQNKVDVIIMDILMPGGMNGIDTTKTIKTLDSNIKIIALTMLEDAASILAMIEAGVDGYTVKNSGGSELKLAISQTLDEDFFIHPDLKQNFISKIIRKEQNPTKELTDMEFKVLSLIAQGNTTIEISAKLFRSFETIKTHRKKLLKKLNCKNTAALISVAVSKKII